MYIRVTYDQEFEDLMMYLRSKYPKELFDLEGIGKQTDMSLFSKEYFASKNVADISVDSNANVDDKSVSAYEVELPKPWFRLNALYLLWKYIRKLYDLQTANKIIEMQITGDIYINDLANINKPYCFNFSTYDIMLEGMPFVKKIKSEPPKHLSSFIGQLIHASVFFSNQIVGAVGLADLLIVASYYVDKLFRENPDVPEQYLWKQVKQELQSFIYSCNQPFRSAYQSGFYNVSVYDRYFLEDLAPNYIFPYGSTPNIEIVQKLQELFLDLMNETLEKTPVIFPIVTACFSVDENRNIRDEEFLKFIAEKNLKYGFINIYAGETGVLSSCCFNGKQKVLVKDSNNGVMLISFEELYQLKNKLHNFTIFHAGSWVKGKIIKLPKQQMYKIITSNNKEFIVTHDHLHLTLDGLKPTSQITVDDYLLFNNQILYPYPEKDLKLTYEQGILIGAYLGDGSIYYRNNSAEITYSFNAQKTEVLLPLMNKGLKDCGIEDEFKIYNSRNNVVFVKLYNQKLAEFIKQWVNGNYNYEKELNINCLLQSVEFRQGIIDGLYLTDGGNSNRIYTTSAKLVEQLEAVFTSLGYNTIINISDRTDEPVIIRDQTYQRNYPLYCIRWCQPFNKRSMSDVYVRHNNNIYFKVKSIEPYETDSEYVYCFVMQNENEPYFTLPNGLITHNCRLRSDSSKIKEYFNSFGSGSTKIGSMGVVTINLPRIAIKAKGDREKFFELLRDVVNAAIIVNRAKRYLLEKRIQVGGLPLYTLGFMDLKHQYSTIGVLGFSETCKFMELDILTEDGQQFVKDILDTINQINDEVGKKYKYPTNCEQVPAENSAIKLAQKDKLLGYQNKYELYSNQFIPLTTEANILDRIKLQGRFDKKMSGGAIVHLNVETQIKDPKLMEDLIRTSIKHGVVYQAVNYNLQRCENEHLTVGKNENCPVCGKPITDNFTRVVGFLTNTKNWHKARREIDYPNRQFYRI